MRTYQKKGTSTKPCHGCGSVLPHWSNQVCDQCAKAIRGYNDIMAERAEAGDMVEMISKERDYALPSIGYTCTSDTSSLIKRRILQITEWLSTPSQSWKKTEHKQIFRFSGDGSRSQEHEWSTVVRIRPEHAEAIGELHEAIGHAVAQASEEGHRKGRSLVLNLAGGHITEDEFNQRALRNAE